MPFDRERVRLARIGPRLWRLEEPLAYTTWAGLTVDIEAGLHSDGMTLGRAEWALRWLLPFWGRASLPVILHDTLLDWLEAGRAHPAGSDRRACDLRMWEAMVDIGLPWPERWVIWTGIRIGARIAANQPPSGAAFS